MRAHAGGQVSGIVAILPALDEDPPRPDLRIVLVSAMELTRRVVDPSGRAIASATVRVELSPEVELRFRPSCPRRCGEEPVGRFEWVWLRGRTGRGEKDPGRSVGGLGHPLGSGGFKKPERGLGRGLATHPIAPELPESELGSGVTGIGGRLEPFPGGLRSPLGEVVIPQKPFGGQDFQVGCLLQPAET